MLEGYILFGLYRTQKILAWRVALRRFNSATCDINLFLFSRENATGVRLRILGQKRFAANLWWGYLLLWYVSRFKQLDSIVSLSIFEQVDVRKSPDSMMSTDAIVFTVVTFVSLFLSPFSA